MAEEKGYIVCIEVRKIAAHDLDNDFCSGQLHVMYAARILPYVGFH